LAKAIEVLKLKLYCTTLFSFLAASFLGRNTPDNFWAWWKVCFGLYYFIIIRVGSLAPLVYVYFICHEWHTRTGATHRYTTPTHVGARLFLSFPLFCLIWKIKAKTAAAEGLEICGYYVTSILQTIRILNFKYYMYFVIFSLQLIS